MVMRSNELYGLEEVSYRLNDSQCGKHYERGSQQADTPGHGYQTAVRFQPGIVVERT